MIRILAPLLLLLGLLGPAAPGMPVVVIASPGRAGEQIIRAAGGRLLLSLEGGYELGALRECVRACIGVLTKGEEPGIHRPA